MNIFINFEYGKEELEAFPLEELARFVLSHERKPDSTEVSISFVDIDKIAALNKTYRHQEGPTDVLSFECDPETSAERALNELPDDACTTLGDVVIAPEVAKAQTQEFGTSFEEEISLLLVHGLLHLCGYDHLEEEEAERMERLEDELLRAWTQR